MRSSKTFALYLLALAIGGCSSADQPADFGDAAAVAAVSPATRLAPCVCGDVSADVHGCGFAACVEGAGNPDNPLCACGPLATPVVPSDATRTVSNGVSALAGLELQVLLDAKGRALRGRMISDDGEKVTVAIELPDGTRGRQSLLYSQLHPRTVYRLYLGRVSLDDGPAQFELAEFAAANGLFDSALRHYLQAAEADPGLFDKVDTALGDLREKAATAQIAAARKALAKDDLDRAQALLSDALAEFPGTSAAATAETLLAALGDRILEQRQEQAAAADAELAKRLEPARARHRKALEHMRSGLAASNSPTQAIRHHEQAETQFDTARSNLSYVRKKHASDTALTAGVDALAELVVTDYVRNEMHLANRYFQRHSYKNARKAVNRVLAVDATHRGALSLQDRIAAAESDDELERRDRWDRRRWAGGGFVRPGWRPPTHQPGGSRPPGRSR